MSFEQMCREFTEQFREVIALEDDMMELLGFRYKENETLKEFLNRYHRAIFDFGAFNHLQALKGLKEWVKIGCLWYNLRNPAIQSYSATYKQAKRDIDIDEEKTARLRPKKLKRLRKKEKKV